ncbi:MAG: ABC1 kinase family protein [Acidimicrobiales bacterium]
MSISEDPAGAASSRPPDCDFAGFSDDPPWLIDPAELHWRDGIEAIRARTHAEVPSLVRRRYVPPAHRMVKVGWALLRAVGAWYIVDRGRGQARSRVGLSQRLRIAFGKLGPTYIKLGQVLSSGEGIFPEEIVSQFRLLRDRVPPESFDVVRRILEAELAGPLEATFAEFDREPIAAASIAQVHGARLRTGERVVVKVQRPDVAELVRRDLAAMSFFAPLLVGRIPVATLANPPALIELFAETIVEELDFRLEAANMLDVGHVLAETDQRSMIVPRPHPRLVTRRMLVMERLDGFAWDDVEGMRSSGIDTTAVLRAAMISFFEGAFIYGVFHGDLHGGNLAVRPDGRVALLDFGITGRLGEHQRLALLQLLIGGSTSNIPIQVQALKELGALPPDADVDQVIRELGLDQPSPDVVTLSADELTDQLRDLTKQLLAYGARLPKELILFVKDMLFLDGAVATLAPSIDLLGEVALVATYFAQRHGERIAADIGVDPRAVPVDLAGLRASMGLPPETERFTYRDLQERRDTVRKKFERKQP